MTSNTLQIGISSSVSSSLSALILNPLDVIKTRQQEISFQNCKIHFQRYITNQQMALNNHQECVCLPKFFTEIIIKEGISSLWRGAVYNILQSCLTGTTYMVFYQNIKRLQIVKNDTLNPAFSAGVARIFTSCILFPLELRKVQKQSSKQNKSIKKSQIRSIQVTLKKDLIFSCIFWTLLEKSKIQIQNSMKCDEMITVVLASSISGLATGLLTTPLDVVKTRKQLNHDLYKNFGTIKSMKQIYNQDGIHGLFKGYQPRCLKTMFANCIYVSLFEFLMISVPNKHI